MTEAPTGPVRSPLRDRTYRRLFLAQVTALAGTGLSTVALALLAYDLAGGDAGAVLGIALALKMIAYVTVAPVVGGLANRVDRRRLLIGLDFSRAGFIACLPFVTEVWQVYVLIFALNACSAGFTPTFQATIPDVLTDEARYTRALSLSRLAYDLESLLSPAAAAAALLLVSYDALFAANAVAFLVSAALVATCRLPSPTPAPAAGGKIAAIFSGSRIMLGTPRLRGLLALYLAVAAGGAMVIVNTVVLVQDRLGRGETGTAMAFAVFGAGSMAVALLLPRILDRHPDRPFMIAGSVIIAGGLLGGADGYGFGLLLALWFVLGVGSSLIQTPAGRLIQRSCAPAERPAVFSAQFALSHLCWMVGYLLAGWVGTAAGFTTAFLVLAGLAAVGATAAVLLWLPAGPHR